MQIYEIFEDYQDDFVKYAQSLTHAKESAEDIVQFAYVKALEQMDIFSSMHPAQVKGWFFKTIHRKFIDEYRRNKRVDVVDEIPERIFSTSSFEDKLLFKDSFDRILESLPENERNIVILRYLNGLNSTEIAECTGLNASTVRSRISQIAPKIRKKFEEDLL